MTHAQIAADADPATLTRQLHDAIPLTRAMALQVIACDTQRVVMHVPFAQNRNLHDTVFAGSLATAATTAGWLLVQTHLLRAGLHPEVVAQRIECDYRLPVSGAFDVTAVTESAALERLMRMLARAGRGRIGVDAQVTIDGRPALQHRAMLAASLRGGAMR